MSHLASPTRDSELVETVERSVLKHLGYALREQQLSAGLELLNRTIAEMPTGEGKTVTTVLPAVMIASSGRKVLVATANDYLAARDAGWMRPVYRDLGLRVAHVEPTASGRDPWAAYDGDVIYGTIRQFAFDYLRDCLSTERQSRDGLPSKFPFDALFVDEADSVLIDEARTPVVITAPARTCRGANEACFRWAAEQAAGFEFGVHFVRTASGAVAITHAGHKRVIATAMPAAMSALTTTEIIHALERAILVNETFHRDRHYVVRHDRIELVDEYTGRRSAQRTLSDGLHQAVEAREGLSLTAPTEQVAGITVQDFVGRFRHLSGLTATAWEARRELRDVFGLDVVKIRSHCPNRLDRLEPRVYASSSDRDDAIAAETHRMIANGRAVLVGTRTVQQSDQLSRHFSASGIEHVVLNARQDRDEAAIVADAGRAGRVTIATNMAGRGTDIRLEPSVANAGGLHVILSSPHAAARIDRQLVGRAGRAGDPGSARLFLSADDELLTQVFGPSKLQRMVRSRNSQRRLCVAVEHAQQVLSRQHRGERRRLTTQSESFSASLRQLGLQPHLSRM